MKGDVDAFRKWQAANKQNWDDFIAWFSKNKIQITKKNAFISSKA